jgi:quinol monooxygenase YgiN
MTDHSQTGPTRRQILSGVGGSLALVVLGGCGGATATPARSSPRKARSMIVEYIRYEIPQDRHQAFVDAYADAAAELRASRHCLRYELSQCVEEPSSFVVRIEWDSLDGHMKGFRAEPEFPPFFAKVKPFFDQIREMRHYTVSRVASPAA